MSRYCQPGQPDLFKLNDTTIGVLRLGEGKGRAHQYTFGLDAVVNELSVNVWKELTPETVNECDIALCSLCSTNDVLELITALDERPKSRLIIGGFGATPFPAWRHLCHRIAFGRAEGAVDKCVLDESPLPWCYDCDRDPELWQQYIIRQTRYLLEGESAVGCDAACTFCQYKRVRRLFGHRYTRTGRGHHFIEDRWKHLQQRSGHQTTALDGWSEDTRKRVNKPVTDEEIVDKLSRMLRDPSIVKTICIKCFMVVGYPWETEASVLEDIRHMTDVLSRVSPGPHNGRIFLMFLVTPFSPEPLTPMEDDRADIYTNWPSIMRQDSLRCVFDAPHLNAYILPQVNGPLTLYKRVAVNRLHDINKLRGVARAKTIDDALAIGGDIWRYGAGDRVSHLLRCEQAQETDARPCKPAMIW